MTTQAPLTALERSFLAVCKRHNLTNLHIDVSIRPDGTHSFTAFAHAGGVCALTDYGGDERATIANAVRSAICGLNEKRGLDDFALADEALPEIVA